MALRSIARKKFSLKLFAWDKTEPFPARNTSDPVWERVEVALAEAFENDGFAILRMQSECVTFISELSFKAQSGRFRIVALTNADDHKERLLEWWESEAAEFRGKIKLGDDEWDARTVCSDLSVAKRIFREYLDSGNLSVGLENMRSPWRAPK
jgi:pyruvate/2-oxoacid:ferredoxin oxidoreductase beta subunit